MISKEKARRLAETFGEVTKIRILDERTSEEAFWAVLALDDLLKAQQEADIEMMPEKTIRKMKLILKEEA